MNITPTNSPAPKYPVLATLAVAAAMSVPACQQQQQPPPQPLGGAPLPPPAQFLGGSAPVKTPPNAPQALPGRRISTP